MPPVIVTPPAAEPISLSELKTAAHIDHATEDSFLTDTIAAARFRYELDTRRQMMTATFDWFLPCFPGPEFEVPLPPLTSVTSITYLDSTGASTVLATSVYDVDTAVEPGVIFLKPNQEWPDLYDDQRRRAVTIRFVAGAATSSDVPELDRKAILLLAQTWTENRESVVIDDRLRAAEVPLSYNMIAEGRKIILVG